MPFTPSHVAAILPFARGRWGRHLDAAALSIGAMVPDLPYFVPPHLGARWTHAWYGPVTLDLVLGLVVLVVWRRAVPALVEMSPRWLRSRFVLRDAARCRTVCLSVVVGATTHVVWDSFSHPRRWGTEHVAWLQVLHGPLPGYKWVQYGSGVGGLLVLGLWLLHWVAVTPVRPVPAVRGSRRHLTWMLIIVVLGAVVATTWVRGASAAGVWLDETTAVEVATNTISAVLALVLLAGLVGWARHDVEVLQ